MNMVLKSPATTVMIRSVMEAWWLIVLAFKAYDFI